MANAPVEMNVLGNTLRKRKVNKEDALQLPDLKGKREVTLSDLLEGSLHLEKLMPSPVNSF